MSTTESYHAFLCRERAACEGDLACFNDPKVVRNVNGQDRVFCWLHDPENGLAEYYNDLEALSGGEEHREQRASSNAQPAASGNGAPPSQESLDELERRNAHDALLRQPSPDERDEFLGCSWRETPTDIDQI